MKALKKNYSNLDMTVEAMMNQCSIYGNPCVCDRPSCPCTYDVNGEYNVISVSDQYLYWTRTAYSNAPA